MGLAFRFISSSIKCGGAEARLQCFKKRMEGKEVYPLITTMLPRTVLMKGRRGFEWRFEISPFGNGEEVSKLIGERSQ